MLRWTKPTIKELLSETKDIDRLDAELLLAHVLSTTREYFIIRESERVTRLEARRYRQLATQRASGKPLAYITGHKEFYGLDFLVSRDTLIPRPETEHMVERMVTFINHHQEGRVLLIDVGTGSGCIPISVLKGIDVPTQVAHTIGIDVSSGALAIAKQNSIIHAQHIEWKCGNLLEPAIHAIQKHCCDIVISANLPYVSLDAYMSEPSIHAEPKSALVAEEEGLALYKELIDMLPKEAETRTTLFLEIDPAQTEEITKIIHTRHPQATISIIKDLAQRDRIVEIHV